MTIIKMLPEHLGEVKALLDTCFGASAWSLDSLSSELNKPDSACTVAVEDDRVIGFLAFEQILDEGSIIEVAVHPDCRRRGVARGLITGAMADNSVKEIYLEVRESNIPAISLYKSLGFEQIAMRRDYYSHPKENALIMMLKPRHSNPHFRKSTLRTDIP